MSAPTLSPAAPTTDGPTEVDLTRLVADVAARPALWRHAVRFDGTERCWTRIDAPQGVDLWVLTWLTFQGTDLHDHGRSRAAFTVVRGALHEIRPDALGRLRPRKFTPGVVATIEPGEVHDVRNELAEPAVSIHAYSPTLTEMTYYAWAEGRITPVRTVLGDEPEQAADHQGEQGERA
jgi:mannose-6-phosphate isomerase-like protein (cupin superfamily)